MGALNILFVFFVPSGGVDSVNRQRCQALRRYGIQADCLYYNWGAGIQNPVDFPIFITSDDYETKQILDFGNYQTIIVTTDHKCFERFRSMGYYGKFILEIQGYGPKETARAKLTEAIPTVNAHASALLNPRTPHIADLFKELYPSIPHFNFNNCFDSDYFTYLPVYSPLHPIIAWVGRIEDNKNWREFLVIGHQLSYYYPDLEMLMFEDSNLSIPSEREQFTQMLDQLNLHGRVRLLSNVPNSEMRYYFSTVGESGGFLISTSKVEGAPQSILEAMSCKCPVLATNSDGVATSVIHNVTGKSYTLGDIGQAVSEARDLINNHVQRDYFRDAAYYHIYKEFGIDKYCKNFINMLYSI
ncbi:glycosyltransferase [Paenibacillus sp. D2_2]|uniref:glycosyltransferase family 4 protein n=1 Tax=Paenibacillus sp. D2_2 TaxID=3073092 RepID=UPI0028165FAA|nr:glycosyltransferase [Paenibacillus sp. D2_2]WMT40187.1 glycosyltransferase [Paenibacillus sp. D2_2]